MSLQVSHNSKVSSNFNSRPFSELQYWQLSIFIKMTSHHKRIAIALLWFYKEEKFGNHKYTDPSHQKIARMARCSESTVEKFMRGIGKLICSWEQRYKYENGRRIQDTNLYTLFPEFFDMLLILEFHDMLYKPSKQLKELSEKMEQNDDHLNEKTCRKLRVMNNDLRSVNIVNLRPIKTYINTNINNVPIRRVPVHKQTRETKSFKLLEKTGISYSENIRMCETFSYPAILETKKDYDYLKNKKEIYNPAGFIYSRAREHMHRQSQNLFLPKRKYL